MSAMTGGEARLTPLARGLVVLGLLSAGAIATVRLSPALLESLAPERRLRAAVVPQGVALPEFTEPSGGSTEVTRQVAATAKPGCAQLPEVRLELWAWNAQLGLLYASGGPQAAEASLMCSGGVNLKLVRQDDPVKMREDLVAFATALKGGEKTPEKGAHLVAIMGDGSATFLKELNDVLGRLGPEYRAKVIGSSGYSWGEDKFMGPPAWRENPAASKGGLVAGVLRDGDWNIAQKWLGENRLCNNPDERTFDPECLNWLATPGYVEAAQAYVAGQCEDRPVVRHGRLTGERKKICVGGVVTWTPGDVTIAQKKGGLVSIVSTREYRGQMPQALIGIDRWMKENRTTVEALLAATFEGGEAVRKDPAALTRGAEISAQVYGEESAAYWEKYFRGVTERDCTGLEVELGGSRVNNLADNLHLFGMKEFAPGSVNLFATTYTVFGELVKAQYPDLVPGISPAAEVVDTSYLEALARRATVLPKADLPVFTAKAPVQKVVSQGAWAIAFETGRATFTKEAAGELARLLDQLVLAGGAAVEIHGHTDSVGEAHANQALSEARAFAVKRWLEQQSQANFSEGRVRVFAHGQQNPIAPNTTPEGRAMNRRVQIVLGTTR